VRACRRIDRAIPAAVIYADHQAVPWFLRRGQGRVIAGANVVKPHHELVSERLVQRHHNRNRGVIAWTVDSGQDALRVARCGVDGIVSNDPSVVLQALSRR
jgi:glycerophosphoryl diester phosphodiesterase